MRGMGGHIRHTFKADKSLPKEVLKFYDGSPECKKKRKKQHTKTSRMFNKKETKNIVDNLDE